MFSYLSFYVRTGEHGMQPQLHDPRRSHFAPTIIGGMFEYADIWIINNFKHFVKHRNRLKTVSQIRHYAVVRAKNMIP